MIVSFSILSVSPPLHQSLPPFHHKFHSLADWIDLPPLVNWIDLLLLHHLPTPLPNTHDRIELLRYLIPSQTSFSRRLDRFASFRQLDRFAPTPSPSYSSTKYAWSDRIAPLPQWLSVSLFYQSPPHSISLFLHSITNFILSPIG